MATRDTRRPTLSHDAYRRMGADQERYDAETDALNEATFVGFCLGLAAAAVAALLLSGIPSAALAALAAYLGGGR